MRSQTTGAYQRAVSLQAAFMLGVGLALSIPTAAEAEPIDVIDIAGPHRDRRERRAARDPR